MNKQSLPKTKNPLGVYLFYWLTSGLYAFYWILYILENLNHINGSPILDVSKVRRIIGVLLFTYLGSFILFLIIVWSGNNQVAESILPVLFPVTIISGSSLLIGLIIFVCFINYQIDVIKERLFQEYTTPVLSLITTILLFVLYFLFIPFTQYKLNTLINLHIEHNT